MKLMRLSLVLIGICCYNNGYAMDKGTEEVSKNLLEANRLIRESEGVINKMNHTLMLAFFTTKEGHDDYIAKEKGTARFLAYQAKNIAEDVKENNQADKEIKNQAKEIILRAHTIIEK